MHVLEDLGLRGRIVQLDVHRLDAAFLASTTVAVAVAVVVVAGVVAGVVTSVVAAAVVPCANDPTIQLTFAAAALSATYRAESSRLPTNTTPNLGRRPYFSKAAAEPAATSDRTESAT